MKTCTSCKQEKPLEAFSWRNKSKQTLQSKCKVCHASYVAQHYKNNSDAYKERATASRPAHYLKTKIYVIEYLKSHPCVDCGITDIRVLQFDHKELVGHEGKRVSSHYGSMKKLIAEIDKCDVRCANCHMIRTGEQLGWLRI